MIERVGVFRAWKKVFIRDSPVQEGMDGAKGSLGAAAGR